MLNQEVLSYIEAHSQEAYELLLTLAGIPAPFNREKKWAEFCRGWLAAQGARGVHVDEALNMVYPVEAEGPVEVYMAHTDVVFPDTREPPLMVENGRICCPGVGDDTACLVYLLMAIKCIVAHVGKPDWDVLRGQGKPGPVLVCNAGEEDLGNLKGVRKICETYGTRMESFCTFDSSLDKIANRTVGSKRPKMTVSTRGGHSFSDFGQDSAVAKLAGIIVRLYEIQVSKGPRTAYNVGLISGGTSVNTIAQQAEVLYEIHSESRESLELTEGRFTSIIGQARAEGLDVSIEVIGIRPCSGDVDPDKEKVLTDRAMGVMHQAMGSVPRRGSGPTDYNIPLSLGILSVCVGCYRGEGAHTRSEYVEIDSPKQGYQVALGTILG